ncbi:Protein FAR1-RELATED SEQUENCE 12 [Linum perenne]
MDSNKNGVLHDFDLNEPFVDEHVGTKDDHLLIEQSNIHEVDEEDSNLDNNLADKDEIEQLALARIRDEQYWSKLRFKTRDETYKFYTDYAHSTGFSVRKASSVRNNSSSSGETHYLRYVCNKEGYKEDSELDPKNNGKLATKKRKRLRAEQRTGCTTIIVFHPDQDAGCYFINEWKDEHNHALHKVEHKQFHRSNRIISPLYRVLSKMFDDAGVPVEHPMMQWKIAVVVEIFVLLDQIYTT